MNAPILFTARTIAVALAKRIGAASRSAQLPVPMDGIVVDDWGQSADQWRRRRA